MENLTKYANDKGYVNIEGLSGKDDVFAYTRFIKVKHYNLLDNNISDKFHDFLADRLIFNNLNKFLNKYI